jgi:site-specific recombinase XerD
MFNHFIFRGDRSEAGTNIRVVQKLLGHADVKTTEIYTHVLQQNLSSVVSPLEALFGKD